VNADQGFSRYATSVDCPRALRILAAECIRRDISVEEAKRRVGWSDRKSVLDFFDRPPKRITVEWLLARFARPVLQLPGVAVRALCEELTDGEIDAARLQLRASILRGYLCLDSDAHRFYLKNSSELWEALCAWFLRSDPKVERALLSDMVCARHGLPIEYGLPVDEGLTDLDAPVAEYGEVAVLIYHCGLNGFGAERFGEFLSYSKPKDFVDRTLSAVFGLGEIMFDLGVDDSDHRKIASILRPYLSLGILNAFARRVRELDGDETHLPDVSA
jgi:hypothetical protein